MKTLIYTTVVVLAFLIFNCTQDEQFCHPYHHGLFNNTDNSVSIEYHNEQLYEMQTQLDEIFINEDIKNGPQLNLYIDQISEPLLFSYRVNSNNELIDAIIVYPIDINAQLNYSLEYTVHIVWFLLGYEDMWMECM